MTSKACPICSGSVQQGTTTFTADLGHGVVVVRHVPARVCSLCGEAWVEEAQAAQLETIVESTRDNKRQFEVIDLAA